MKYFYGFLIVTCISFNTLADPVDNKIKVESSAAKQQTSNNPVGIDTWGLGFGLGIEQYRNTYIDDASLRGDNRIVTTEKTFETRPSAWLTMNWNIWGIGGPSLRNGVDVQDTKWGFFAGVKLLDANSEAFSAFSLGPQVSFVLENRVVSVGLGWVTHQSKQYAHGIVAGEPLPTQYDDIVFEEGTENSFMLMVSVGF